MTAEHLETVTPAPAPTTPLGTAGPDPFAWLEEVEGDAALAWVRERDDRAHDALGGGGLDAIEEAIREVLDSDARIPDVSRVGDHLYNFWRDATHERGLWRRTTLDEYRTDDPRWETVLDLDALAEAEGVSWVWHGASLLRPTPEQLAAGEPWRRALVDLSPGGSDADVTRELDLVEKRFVPAAEGGFERDTARSDGSLGAKGGLAWADEDSVYVFTDFGAGTTTPSGYPRVVKLWRRGTPLADAVVVYEGAADDMYISARRSRTPGFERDVVSRSIAFYRQETFLAERVGTPDQVLVKVDVPESAEVGFHREWLLVELREDWTPAGAPGEVTYPAGSLLAAPVDAFLAGSRELTVLFEPTGTTSLVGATWTRHHLVVTVLDDVKNRLHVLTPPADASAGAPGAGWERSELPVSDDLVTVAVRAVDPVESDAVWLTTTGYLTPSTLALSTASGPGAPAATPEVLKSAPAFFDARGLVAVQHFATSVDGTRVPYFVVGRSDLVHPADPGTPGTAPTLLYGYGGFEIPLLPGYSGSVGRAWLARGGVYVVANIRGGGEYGPRWHQAALRSARHRAYEDFAAVARDLVARGITSPAHLGAQGGSNGGLLAGNMLTQYPELFGAVVVQVPLLDMKRYTHLLAGASWMAEYGDPDTDDWDFVRTFSPYHLFDGARDYPPVLFTTSTKDDRVHPGHARKLAALMLAAGKDVTYYENVEGGHGGAATNAQAAHMAALAWTFLHERLAG
ncbi:prolyl oligopeptidase family serine peptidase [Isoptericola sp. NEAU-Y5]|uniref:Prolyl oligopeptidase family serine peptidase n=1 Tax=Isoptericola luteus TaxID=2879484 RepID=A0ABS7ZL59_9MICO|nr:prolyl oligopeptidase family serine peptidase [Isoptericola sp. NEAU-Y5]MCA5895212.1 prolyl oligopeptidase family serine peptidase [Isoptericola sp. NEAU-Y5]